MNQHVCAYYLHRIKKSMKATRRRCEMYLIWSDGKLLTMPEHYKDFPFTHPALKLRAKP